ncbi:MAG: hypothetical protein WA770_13540, partial [Pseudolabrys sp.]
MPLYLGVDRLPFVCLTVLSVSGHHRDTIIFTGPMAVGMIRAIETGRAAAPTLRLFPRFRLIRDDRGTRAEA